MKIAAHFAISFHVYHIGFLWYHLYLRVAMLKTISWQNLKKKPLFQTFKSYRTSLRIREPKNRSVNWEPFSLRSAFSTLKTSKWDSFSWSPHNTKTKTLQLIVDFREVRTNIHLKWRSKQSDILYEISVLRGPHYTQTMTSKWSWFSMSFAIHCQWRSQR